MVVALGTLNSHAHKYLGNILRNLQRVGFHLVVVRGCVFECSAAGTQEFLDHLIDWHFIQNAFLHPVVISQHRFVGDLLSGANH